MAQTKSWYGSCGSLLTDKPVKDLTTPAGCSAYGKPNMVGESMSKKAAIRISKAFGLDYQGELDEEGVS
jgi:hypothetical protein